MKEQRRTNTKTCRTTVVWQRLLFLAFLTVFSTIVMAQEKVSGTVVDVTGEAVIGASDLQIKSYAQLPAEDEAVLAAIGANGDYERMLNFVFNERTRELLGEWNRWDELARTNLLVKRAKAFNTEAAPNIQDRHNYRPIPQKFIDTLQNPDDTNLSDADKKAWQNPGY